MLNSMFTCALGARSPLPLLVLLLSLGACGGGSDTATDPDASTPPATPAPPVTGNDGTPASVASYAVHALQLTSQIVDATSAAQAVDGTRQALASGGVRVAGGSAQPLAARAPAASWDMDSGLAFNLAAEAHDRAVSGRLTLAELGQMWADFGFPFAGTGTPGQQLLGFLRESLLAARAQPAQANGFTPLFIAEMAQRQQPAFDLADAAAQPEALRLSLLEIELLHAMFDRAFKSSNPSASDARKHAAAVSDGLCDEMKKFYGAIGGKLIDSGVDYLKDQLADKALGAIGMTQAEIKLFSKYGKMFGALSSALKVVKLAQMYAAGQATLSVEGANPVRKPAWNGARQLVSVKATAGVPDQDWQDYQKANGSESYQTAKSCLGQLGAPMPLDLKDIASAAGDWRVGWDLTKGSPKHALVPTDVNDFNASIAGNPFGMKLVRTGAASAEARLKVDIKEESQLATLFQGPIVTTDVRVRARVFTNEPPSPLLLAQITSVLGTVSALVDLSVGWAQAMLPPVSSTVIKVEYHDVPLLLDASMQLSMSFDAPHFRSDPPRVHHTLAGNWAGRLTRETKLSVGTEYEFYQGSGIFSFGALSTLSHVDDSGCNVSYAYAKRDGLFWMNLGPAVRLDSEVNPDGPEQLGLGAGGIPVSDWPQEQKTMTVACPGPPPDTTTISLPFTPEIFVAAANAMNLQDALLMTEGIPPPGMYLNRGRLLTDGTLELSYTAPTTVSIIVPGADVLQTKIVSQNSVIRLRPTYAPPQ